MTTSAKPSADAPAVRLDVWLWAARFFKTRALAKQAIEGGRIDLNDDAAKPARLVRAGDRLGVTRAQERMHIVVVALSAQRGPASIAQTLYTETAESKAEREREREWRRLTGAGLAHPQGRPGKHARRQLRDLKEGAS